MEQNFVEIIHPCNTKQKYRIKSQEKDIKSQIPERKLQINQPYHAGVMQEEKIPKRHVVRSRMDVYIEVIYVTRNEEGMSRMFHSGDLQQQKKVNISM